MYLTDTLFRFCSDSYNVFLISIQHICADTLRSVAVLLAAGIALCLPTHHNPALQQYYAVQADAGAALMVSIIILLSIVPLLRGIVRTGRDIFHWHWENYHRPPHHVASSSSYIPSFPYKYPNTTATVMTKYIITLKLKRYARNHTVKNYVILCSSKCVGCSWIMRIIIIVVVVTLWMRRRRKWRVAVTPIRWHSTPSNHPDRANGSNRSWT